MNESKQAAKIDCAALYVKADAAGKAAVEKLDVVAMVVSEADGLSGEALPGGRSWFVADGACGFAWVRVRPANCAFAKWLKANKDARVGYGGGMELRIGAYNQSMQKKEAYAEAFAAVLCQAGIKAYSDSRMD